MISVPYKVIVVVDRNFGERLVTLPEGTPVWIVDTPINSPVAHCLWKERKHNDLMGITIFQADSFISPEAILIGELDTIDLHHGSFSADPPYVQLEVYGTHLCNEIRTELFRYGFNEFDSTLEGFRASRSASTHQV
jgi:hypothetical protein